MTKARWILSILLMMSIVSCSDGLPVQPTPSEEDVRENLPLATVQGAPASEEITETVVTIEPEQRKSEALNKDMSSYTGPNAYGSELPDYVVNYDSTLWQLVLVKPNQGNDRLESTLVPSCTLLLNMGPIGSPAVLQEQIGSYQWYIAETNDPQALLYWAKVSDTLSFFFGLKVPNALDNEQSQACIALAEEIMSTAAFVVKNN